MFSLFPNVERDQCSLVTNFQCRIIYNYDLWDMSLSIHAHMSESTQRHLAIRRDSQHNKVVKYVKTIDVIE